jgi:OmpA-OmpF porin, OOP family
MKFLFYLLVLFQFHIARSQNLISNPSFEEYSNCPSTYKKGETIYVTERWKSPDSGSPDLYNSCSNGDVGIPNNWAGRMDALDGDGYVGIYLWKYRAYKELLIARLNSPLIADSTYMFGCYLAHAANSEFRYHSFEFGFSRNEIVFDGNYTTDDKIYLQKTVINEPIKNGWSFVNGEYKSNGGESFLILGIINSNQKMDTSRWLYNKILGDEPQLNKASYYYIDSVFVMPKYDTYKEVVLNLSDIHFDFNKYDLTKEAERKIDSLLGNINIHLEKIIIEGHTDSIGSDSYNLKLSQKRAESAEIFLQKKVTAPISIFALGEFEPIASNSDELSRSKNRRITIRIIYTDK